MNAIDQLAEKLRTMDGGVAFAQAMLTQIVCEECFDAVVPGVGTSTMAAINADERHAAEQLLAALESDGPGWDVNVEFTDSRACKISTRKKTNGLHESTYTGYSAHAARGKTGNPFLTGSGSSPMAAVRDLLAKVPEHYKAPAPVAPELRALAGAMDLLSRPMPRTRQVA